MISSMYRFNERRANAGLAAVGPSVRDAANIRTIVGIDNVFVVRAGGTPRCGEWLLSRDGDYWRKADPGTSAL